MKTAILVVGCVLLFAIQTLGMMRFNPHESDLYQGRSVQFGPDNVTQHIGYINVNGTFGKTSLFMVYPITLSLTYLPHFLQKKVRQKRIVYLNNNLCRRPFVLLDV